MKSVAGKIADVPFVFYSRKITPGDVIRVLRASAVDAIRKGALEELRQTAQRLIKEAARLLAKSTELEKQISAIASRRR